MENLTSFQSLVLVSIVVILVFMIVIAIISIINLKVSLESRNWSFKAFSRVDHSTSEIRNMSNATIRIEKHCDAIDQRTKARLCSPNKDAKKTTNKPTSLNTKRKPSNNNTNRTTKASGRRFDREKEYYGKVEINEVRGRSVDINGELL